ncbi:helicase carboxy-terminal domain protein (macronuclear) [Tetrahymena thermophila SB210]|uniref:Helicase carboxy-terminal domain protein n=1 Tax=Tetrahymena thermophila (strain SB210) TaxID=312017 RepID=Q22NE3_TETTS|nr:helicase carboxy-terminal domain protein [Tetrahymena thermophila SB210]EAR86842.2 helicase carboxy-terminal domain protein [Tetrahymena thermophila SB210]|eukprot:XP_001007087.2 helicase carboxy-terminal domain protein [Tetrahymena thermophila SB210]
MDFNLNIQEDTLLQIEQILSQYSQNGKLIFGKTQLVLSSLLCPFRGNWNKHLQDLDYTLKISRNIALDPIKARNLNPYFIELYERCVNNNQNKQTAAQAVFSQNKIITQQQETQITDTLESVQLIIDSYLTSFNNKSLSLLVVISSLLSEDLNKMSFTEKLFAYTQQLNQIKIQLPTDNTQTPQQKNSACPNTFQNKNLKVQDFIKNNKIQQENKLVGLSNQNIYENQNLNVLNRQKSSNQNEQETQFKKPYEKNNIEQYPQNSNLKNDNKQKQQQYLTKLQPKIQKDINVCENLNQIQQNIFNQNNVQLKKLLSLNIQDKQKNQQIQLKKQFSNQIQINSNKLNSQPLNLKNQCEIKHFNQQEPIKFIENRQTSIQNQPKFYSEEVDSILKQIKELTENEREIFMKLFGKYLDGMNGQFLDDLKKRYPEIYYLIQSSKALEKVSKMTPRSVQIVSCLLFLYKQKQKGRILQINTGEGKSITVAMIAATRCLMKDKVDVFTSNKELAKRDCEEFQMFYKELGLTCGSIGSEQFRSSEPNETYKKNVVYGDVGSYAADLLGDYYEQRGTRCGRLFDFAIVDEVDCMLIDQHNHSTSLAKSIPGLTKLNTILWLIWYKITQMRDQYLEGYYYFVENQDKKYCCRAEDFITEFINQTLMRGEISAKIDELIPNHIKSFAMSQMKEWVMNGFYAQQLQRNKEYKVENDKIIPIDYDNTGVAQLNTQWRGGLHQFIQMKENVTVTPMNMTVNFVSNIYMFLLYKTNLVGLTGTLGSFKSIDVLQQFYQVDTLKVPPFKPRKLQILPPIIEQTTLDFQKTIINEIGLQMNKGSPCLIISESEKFSKHISKLISKRFQNIKIVEYYTGNESIEKESINEFCIILSTNLAGRGTDIKLSTQIINNGGLHVIVTFTPKNKRVEDQAFGRAGRCGQDGSAQMVIDGSKDSFIIKNKIQSNLIEERDKVDAQICEKQLQNMIDISKMDEIFWDYCKTLNTCEILKKKQYLRKQEEEIWATFYCKIQNMRKEPEKAMKEYMIFKEDFQKRVNERNVVNPSYLISEGMKLLIEKKFTEALQISDEIILKNPKNLAAHYIKAIAFTSLKQHSISLQMLDKCEMILQQKNSLHQALQILQLQSQSLVQQEYNQELYEQSILLSKNFMNQAQESKIFNINKYDRKQLESYISESGCFKRIKDEELIRGKILEQIRDLKGEIKVLQRNISKKENLNFIRIDEFFQDDKITQQIIKEYLNEELPFVINLFERKPLQWKSLIPLACSIFQLSNSLYLMQDSIIQKDNQNNLNKQNMKLMNDNQNYFQNDNYIEVIQEHNDQVQGIANAIEKMMLIDGLNLKEYMSQESIVIIYHIRKFQIQDYVHMLTQISDHSANKIQKELIIQISFKDALTKEVAKYSKQIAYITQQMAQDQKFLNISQLQTKFQLNCSKILEQTQAFQLINKNQIENIYKAFKQQFQYLNFQHFERDIVRNLRQNLIQHHKKQIIDNLESFIKDNYELLLSPNQFFELVYNLMQDPLNNVINLTIQNMQTIVCDTICSYLVHKIKQEINYLKQLLQNQAQKMQKLQQNNNYTINTQNKIKNYEKIQNQLEQDEGIIQQFMNSLKQAITQFKLDVNNSLSLQPQMLEKVQIKNFILNNNQNLVQKEEFLTLIQQILIQLQEKNQLQYNSKEFQNYFVKKIQIEILIPTFKTVSHIFLQQIESNAIQGLFSHIIQ